MDGKVEWKSMARWIYTWMNMINCYHLLFHQQQQRHAVFEGRLELQRFGHRKADWPRFFWFKHMLKWNISSLLVGCKTTSPCCSTDCKQCRHLRKIGVQLNQMWCQNHRPKPGVFRGKPDMWLSFQWGRAAFQMNSKGTIFPSLLLAH